MYKRQLFGLTIQNGVILVSKLKALLAGGMPLVAALEESGRGKFHPILIAVLVAAAGLMPAALSTEIGAQSQRPFAIVIAMAILPSTILSMLFVPALAKLLLRRK